MKAHEHDRFWLGYNRGARPAIERACRSASHFMTDGGMDEFDMMAWVDDKVWRMLRESAWPAFHDDPGPDLAIRRIESSAALLARWSYLALCRRYWRHASRCRCEADQPISDRVERLACAESQGERVEVAEQVAHDLDRIRRLVSERLRSRLAASWPQSADRHRIALLLGVSDPDADALIERSVRGEIRPNTIQQMRSRARRHVQEILTGVACAVCVAALFLAVPAAEAKGEQTGGRRGRTLTVHAESAPQSVFFEDQAPRARPSRMRGGEQTGGRGG